MAQPYQQVSPLSSISYMQEQYEAGRERRKQQQLGQLASQAYAPGADQQSILQQAAAIDPKAAGDIQTQMDAKQRKVIGAAGYMRNALATGNPMAIQGAWRTVRKGLIQSGIGTEQDYQEQWQPEYEQFVHQMLASGAGSSGTGVQSTYVDDQGNRVAILRDGSTRVLGANNPTIRVLEQEGQVPVGVVTSGGRAGQVIGLGQSQSGQQAYIDPSLPAEVQAQIRQAESTGQPIPSQMYYSAPQVSRTPTSAEKAAAEAAARRRVELSTLPQELGLRTQAAIQQTAGQESARAAAERQSKQQQAQAERDATFRLYQTAIDGARRGLEGTETGPIAGRIPAITAAQQTAEGGVSAMAPVLKQLFRVAGEGTFTDKDQELLLRMIPTRTDLPEAREAKLQNIDNIVRAKLQQQPTSAPAGKTVIRTGTLNGRRVVQYSDGTADYAD